MGFKPTILRSRVLLYQPIQSDALGLQILIKVFPLQELLRSTITQSLLRQLLPYQSRYFLLLPAELLRSLSY